MEVDVIIVGAGLAGLSAASEIASHSRSSIALVERHAIGSNNPTPMTFVDVPRRYGLEDCVIGRYRSFTFHSPLGNRSRHNFADVQLVALAYRRACQVLLERASTAGNLQVFWSAASGLARMDRFWKLTLSDGRQLRSPVIIDASGRGLFTSRALGLVRPRYYSHCYGARLSNCTVPDSQETFFFAPYEAYGNGGGWLYPLENNQVSFGFASLGSLPVLPGGAIKSNFQRALAEFEPYSTWLKDAAWDHVEVGSIPIYPLKRFVYDGLLIAGDSAGQATIWSCMGSEAALEAGQLAGEAVLRAIGRGVFDARALSLYQARWDERHRRIYRHNSWIAPTVWSQSDVNWNRQIPLVERLTADQMLDRLRINWPVPTLTQAVFIRSYDLAGRARRGLVHRFRSLKGDSEPLTSTELQEQHK
jgi:flavin-dependent dehydrogenase